MEKNWFSISYLKDGTGSQQKAFQVLSDLDILNVLKPFNATLTGTFPLGIDIPGSDLDICCESPSLPALSAACQQAYGVQKGFNMQEKEIAGNPTLLVRFFLKN